MPIGPIEELIRRYQQMIYRRCFEILRSQPEAEDAMQATFFQAWKARDQFRGQGPYNWLYAITTNVCLAALRKRHRELRKTREYMSCRLGDEGGTWVTLPFARTLLSQILDIKDPKEQAIVFLRFIDEENLQTIAELLDCSEKTVRNIIERFRAKHAEGEVP